MLRRPPTQIALTRDDLRAYAARRAEHASQQPQAHQSRTQPSRAFPPAGTTAAQQADAGAHRGGWPSSLARTAAPPSEPDVDDDDDDEELHLERDLDASIPGADNDSPTEDADSDADVDMDAEDDTFDGRGARRGVALDSAMNAGGDAARRAAQTQQAQHGRAVSQAQQRRARIMGGEGMRTAGSHGMGAIPPSRRAGGGR